MRFEFDEDLAGSPAKWLKSCGYDVRNIRADLKGKPDTVVISTIASAGHILVSRNRRQLDDAAERTSIRDSGARVVYFPPSYANMKLFKQGQWIFKHWEKIYDASSNLAKGEVAIFYANGRHKVFAA